MVRLNSIIIFKIIFIECDHLGRKLILHSFLVMRTFKVYSLSNFQTPNRVLLTIITVLYICTLHFAHLPSPTSGDHQLVTVYFFLFASMSMFLCVLFWFLSLLFFWFHISYDISVSLISLCIMPSRSVHVVNKCQDFILFVWLNNVPHIYDMYTYISITISLSVHLLMDM